MTTLQPLEASSSAVAAPIPVAEPVMTAAHPLTSMRFPACCVAVACYRNARREGQVAPGVYPTERIVPKHGFAPLTASISSSSLKRPLPLGRDMLRSLLVPYDRAG